MGADRHASRDRRLLVGRAILPDAPGSFNHRLGAGIAIFLAGALGVEALTGQIVGLQTRTWLYLVFSTIEEGAEMIGVVVFLDGLLVHLETSFGAIPLQFVEHGKSGVEAERAA